MQFFTEYAKRKTVVLTSVTDASAAVDGDKSSFVNAPSALPRLRIDLFQSPFHRGNGCNVCSAMTRARLRSFQSPFHRGNGCN